MLFSRSVMSDSLRLHGLQHARLPCPSSSPSSWWTFKCMSIELMMPSNHLILCHPLLLPSIFPSIRVFSSESVLHIRWPKYWSFSFSISPSNEYSGLISFRTDCFDLLVVQGTLKSLLQHHGSKASILRGSVQQSANAHCGAELEGKQAVCRAGVLQFPLQIPGFSQVVTGSQNQG